MLLQHDRFQPKHIDFAINAEQAMRELEDIAKILKDPGYAYIVGESVPSCSSPT